MPRHRPTESPTPRRRPIPPGVGAVLCLGFGLAGCRAGPEPIAETPPSIDPDATTRLVIEVETAKWSGEKLYLAVFQSPDDFLERDRWDASATIPVEVPVTRVVFEDVRVRPSAISGFIDLEEDQNLTRNVIGLPVEPWGFSNDRSVIFGLPSFEEVAVDLKGPETVVRFRMDTALDRSGVRAERRRAAEGTQAHRAAEGGRP